MKDENHNVLVRLRRASGQITALTNMIEQGEDCEKVLIQFLAAKAAVEKAFSESLLQNLKKCSSENRGQMLEKIIQLLVKN